MARFFAQIAQIVRKKKGISPDDRERIEELLLESDIGVAVTDTILDALMQMSPADSIDDLLARNLQAGLLETSFLPLKDRPDVMVFFGVNGTGKTTSIGKVAALLRRRVGDIGIVLTAADTFRAAAREQLEVHALRTNSRLVSQGQHADPAAVVFDAIASAKARDDYVVLVDTAGRMHTNKSLIDELIKIQRIVKKHEVSQRNILTLDANTGHNALSQVEEFHAAIGIDAILLTKVDSAASGGILIPIAKQFGIPCIGIGTGEQYDDLEEFHAKTFVELMLRGISDV